jgi:glycosyltransferase involved in cell wall biosynthesis
MPRKADRIEPNHGRSADIRAPRSYVRRVLHVLWALEQGGAPVYQLVQEQRRRGIEADVLVGSRGGFYARLVREAGAHVHELNQRGALDATVARRAAEVFNEYSIIHFHAREPLLITFAARCTGPRLFYSHRGGNDRYPLKKRLRHEIIGHHLRRRFEAVAANTRQGAKAASRIFRLPLDDIQVVYNGLDFTLLEPRRSRAEVLLELGDQRKGITRIGTAAILRPLKRIDRLLQAVATLQDETVHCYVLGDGPARAELELLASRLGIAERVTFAGHKTYMGDYLQLLDIFVLPSGPEESFGNAVVEAMSVGVPAVIFADGGGLTEHIDDNSTGVIASDQSDFERSLKELATDPVLRRRLGAAGKASVRRKYTLEAMADAHSRLYERRSSHKPSK